MNSSKISTKTSTPNHSIMKLSEARGRDGRSKTERERERE
jgi:hypothetical protein